MIQCTSLTNQSEAFLRKLRQGLTSLPLSEQDEIVAELRSHFLSRQDQGDTAHPSEKRRQGRHSKMSKNILTGGSPIRTLWLWS
jgi:hypothetical protein